RFPSLTLLDLQRKKTDIKRQIGDSRNPDGIFWEMGEEGMQSLDDTDLLGLPGATSSSTAQKGGETELTIDSSAKRIDRTVEDEDGGDDEEEEVVDLSKLWDPTIGLSEEEV